MLDVNAPAQKIMVELLRALVGGVKVHTFYPRDASPKMVVVQRTGGSMKTPITDSALFAVQCYGPTELEAEELACGVWLALARGAEGSRVDGFLVRGWEPAGGPARFMDPGRPDVFRFQFSGQLLVSTLKTP